MPKGCMLLPGKLGFPTSLACLLAVMVRDPRLGSLTPTIWSDSLLVVIIRVKEGSMIMSIMFMIRMNMTCPLEAS